MTDADAVAIPGDSSAVATPGEVAGGPRWRTALYPVLFAAYPVLFLWSQNLAEADLDDVLLPLLVSMAAAALLTIVLGLILRDIRKAALILTPVIIGLLGYGHATRLSQALDVPGVRPAGGMGGGHRRGDRPGVPALATQPGAAGQRP